MSAFTPYQRPIGSTRRTSTNQQDDSKLKKDPDQLIRIRAEADLREKRAILSEAPRMVLQIPELSDFSKRHCPGKTNSKASNSVEHEKRHEESIASKNIQETMDYPERLRIPVRMSQELHTKRTSQESDLRNNFPSYLPNENKVLHTPGDLRTMLQMYTAALYSLRLRNDSCKTVKGEVTQKADSTDVEDKGSIFLMKNILREDEKKERNAADDHASRLEVVVSSMGKTEMGHKCMYCGKVYSRKYGLKIHIRTHTGYKPLRCKVCLRPFGDPSNLNKHVRLHSQGSTLYQCQPCGKVLVRKRDLDRHMLSRHPKHPQQ